MMSEIGRLPIWNSTAGIDLPVLERAAKRITERLQVLASGPPRARAAPAAVRPKSPRRGKSMVRKAQLFVFVLCFVAAALARAAAAQICAPAAPAKGEDHVWLYPQSCDPLATTDGPCYSVS